MKKKEQKPQTNLGNQKSISEALQLSSVPIILPQKYNETEEMSGLQCSAILQSKDLDYTPKKLASVCSTGHSEHFQTEFKCTLPEALHIHNFRRSFIISKRTSGSWTKQELKNTRRTPGINFILDSSEGKVQHVYRETKASLHFGWAELLLSVTQSTVKRCY